MRDTERMSPHAPSWLVNAIQPATTNAQRMRRVATVWVFTMTLWIPISQWLIGQTWGETLTIFVASAAGSVLTYRRIRH
jgi:hypothetical protein